MIMPAIPLSHLSADELAIAGAIIATKGKNKGLLRASKPKVEYTIVEKDGRKLRMPTLETGRAAYVWRMVAFQVSPIGQHHCLPILADFDLPGSVEEARAEAKRLDVLVEKIVNAIPKSQWSGIHRWARALGG